MTYRDIYDRCLESKLTESDMERKKPLGESLRGTVICELTVNGEPQSKNRPRFGKGRVYTDRKTKVAEEEFYWEFRSRVVSPDEDHEFAVELHFRTKDGQRKDLDNMIKTILDGANAVVWADDVQVTAIHADLERRSPNPGVDIKITRRGRVSTDCGWCGTIIPRNVKGMSAMLRKYCSKICYDRAQRTGTLGSCRLCGQPIYRSASAGAKAKKGFCDYNCWMAFNRGKNRPEREKLKCKYGHEKTRRPSGTLVCRVCAKETHKKYRRQKKG